jgi:mxaD protein
MKKDSGRSTPNWSAIGRRSFISMAAALGVGVLTGPVLALTKTDPTASNEGKMPYEASIEIKAPERSFWDVFKTFGRIHDWHPATENTVLLVGEEGKPLAVREFQIKGGGFVISELLEYSEADMWFKYRIIKTDLPLKFYVAEMRVSGDGKGSAIVEWKADFEHPNLASATAEEKQQTYGLVQTVFRAGLENIQRLATQ